MSQDSILAAEARFELGDQESWLRHLDEKGFVVIKEIAKPEDVCHATNCLWRDIEANFGANQNDIKSWDNIPTGSAGILSRCLPQSEGAWHIRALDRAKETFSYIWNTDDLIVSMDSVLLWLPWWKNPVWRPVTEGLHIDQNPFFKPERCCVQGMIPLIDVTEKTGGLEVVPYSHLPTARDEFKARHLKYERRPADWCPLNSGDPLGNEAQLIKAKAGDMILWDSRLLHGGKVGIRQYANEGQKSESIFSSSERPELARLSITVCMTPRSFATLDILKRRKRGYENGHTFTHWPHEARITSISPKTSVCKLSSSQKALI